jgi:hypothetical protein
MKTVDDGLRLYNGLPKSSTTITVIVPLFATGLGA